MKKSSFKTVFISCLLLISAAVFAQITDSKTAYAAEAVKPFIDSGLLPGIINIFSQGNVQETVLCGWAHVDQKIPIRMDQLFMQCSQTKGFCGVTIAILVEEGRISLDDPISKYLPEFKNLKVAVKGKDGKTVLVPAKNAPTIRMAMNHTAGFIMEIKQKLNKGWPSVPLRESARIVAGLPLLFEPGTKVSYANTGVDVAAAVVEVVTGQKWDVFLKERVLDPLGMKDSSFNPTDEQLSRVISLYETPPGKKAIYKRCHSIMPLPHNGPNIHPSAGAGLWTTANDQLKFYRMLMNLGIGDNGVRILKEETVKNLLATSSRPAGMEKYSLGFAVGNNGEFGHGGAWGTKCTVNWKTKQLELRVVQVTQGHARPWEGALKKAAEKFFTAHLDTSSSDSYTGRMK
jgi:CubicO group peptidase (beta-lactamase class C family)